MAKSEALRQMSFLLALYLLGIAFFCRNLWFAAIHVNSMDRWDHPDREVEDGHQNRMNSRALKLTHPAKPPSDPLGIQIPKKNKIPEESTTLVENGRPQKSSIPIKDMSVLQYHACCGLGHRLGRQGAAWRLAHELGFKLDIIWKGCGGNVFEEFFFPEDEIDLAYVNFTHEMHTVMNEVPGFISARMVPPARKCVLEELQSYRDMYTSMKRRFKGRKAVDSFVKDIFEGRFSIGIHVRAGNGETGEFTNKGRQMNVTHETYTQRVSKRLVELLNKSNNTLPPVLFVATDTAQYIDLFRKELEGVMSVVAWQQEREAEGAGVFFGKAGQGSGQKKDVDNIKCLNQYKGMLFDMMLLASTDLLVAGHYSSFSQTMPLSLVMGNHKANPNAISESFCEVYEQGMDLTCYSSKMDWCRGTRHRITHQTLNIKNRTFNAAAETVFLKDKLYSTKRNQKKADR